MTMTAAPTGLSQSEIAQWYRCRRKWLIEQFWGFLPAEQNPTGPRMLGIRMAAAMEAHYDPRPEYHFEPGFVLDVLYGVAVAEYPDAEEDLRAEHELARIMADGYLKHAADEGWDAGLTVVQTEAQVRVPLPGFEGYVDLRAKMDRVALDQDTGLLYFIDDKTSADFKRDDQLSEDPQMRFYSLIQWLASGQPPPMLGQPVMIDDRMPLVLGGEIRTLRRVKRSPKSKPPYYGKARFSHTPDQMAATLANVQQAAREILTARQQLEDAYARGGRIEQINWLQQTTCRPNWILRDCSWSCPHSSGLCQMMNQGTNWADQLVSSGRYVRGDAYARYETGPLDAIREQLASR